MALRIRIEGRDPADVHVRLSEMADRAGGGLSADWAGPAVSTELANIIRERFESGGFGSWPPLADSTIRARRRGWGHYQQSPAPGVTPEGPFLQWTRRLMYSLTDPRGRGAADATIRMTPSELVQGTSVPYAVYHQKTEAGGTYDLMALRDEDTERLEAVFLEFVLAERP